MRAEKWFVIYTMASGTASVSYPSYIEAENEAKSVINKGIAKEVVIARAVNAVIRTFTKEAYGPNSGGES